MTDTPSGTSGSGRAKTKPVGGEGKLGDPVRHSAGAELGGGRRQHLAVMLSAPLQRSVEIGGRVRLQAADHADPPARRQGQRGDADSEMVVAVEQAALALRRQVEILDPGAVKGDIAARRRQGQREATGVDDESAVAELQPRIELPDRGLAVMVAAGGQQPDSQLNAGRRASASGSRRQAA